MINDFEMDNMIKLKLITESQERAEQRADEQQKGIHFGYYNISQPGECLRRQYWDYTQGNTPGLGGLRNMKLGEIVQNWTNQVLIDYYKDELVIIERTLTIPIQTPNIQTEEWIYLTGRIDHLVSFKAKNNRRYFCPIEAKYLVDKLINQLKEPKRKHLYQTNSYMLAMNGDTGFIYYVDHHLEAKTFKLSFDQELWKETKNRVISLHDYIKHQELPPAEAMFKDEMKGDCWFCPFNNECRKLEEKK